jgi:hypothetical protein
MSPTVRLFPRPCSYVEYCDPIVDPMLHATMVKFSMFAITCSRKSLEAIIELVKSENILSQEGADGNSQYIRKLHVSAIL